MEPFKVVDDGSQGDPYRHYEWMRENAPVLRCASPVSDVWFISVTIDVFEAILGYQGLLVGGGEVRRL